MNNLKDHCSYVPDAALGLRLITNFVVAEICLIVGNLVARICLREDLLPIWAAAAVALAAAIPMLLFAGRFFHLLRSELDEMLQRIVLEGLAFAMVVFIPLAGLYVNARSSGLIQVNFDPPELLLIPSILIVIGVLWSWSRHK